VNDADPVPARSPRDGSPLGGEWEQEIFGAYGVAIALVQRIESKLLALIAVFPRTTPSPPMSFSEAQERAEKWHLGTFGQQLRLIEERVRLPEQLQEQLRLVLGKRNWLVHAYWTDRGEYLANENRQWEVLEELRSMIDEFRSLDDYLEDKTAEIATAVGLDHLAVNERLDTLTREGKALDGLMDEVAEAFKGAAERETRG
jgi:AcrR family transcriptional regulator